MSASCPRGRARKSPLKLTGQTSPDVAHGVGEPPERPLSLAWVTDELLARTREVWSKAYGRVVSAEEAVEILRNVKSLAEVLLHARKEAG